MDAMVPPARRPGKEPNGVASTLQVLGHAAEEKYGGFEKYLGVPQNREPPIVDGLLID